jgi:catechol 2,3-dioxygenase-like lactoylglutathione lyase family enzyme
MAEVVFHQSVPILCVLQLDEAIAFYARLGFMVFARFEGYALLGRDDVSLHLRVPNPSERITAEANPCGAYFYLRGVDGFRAMVEQQGIRLLGVPEDKPYGVRECAISDPDGNLLRFGEPLG